MSLIAWLNQHPVFIEEVTFQVEDSMKGRELSPPDVERMENSTISSFKLVLPIQLYMAECEGLTCAIPFEATGIATAKATTDAGEITFTRRGKVFGIVDVKFPENSWSPEAYLRMYPHIERIVVVESVEFEGD